MTARELYALLMVLVVGTAHLARGADRVTIESMSVDAGNDSVVVGIYIANDVDVSAIVVPLMIRSATSGAFIANSLSLAATGRLAAFQQAGTISLSRVYSASGTYTETNRCPVDSLGHIWSPADSGADFVSPDALMHVAIRTEDTALYFAGDDGTPDSGVPSLELRFGVGMVRGRFEIDTACIPQNNHLMFGIGDFAKDIVVPSFTKSIIEVGGPFYDGDTISGHVQSDISITGSVVISGDLTVDSGFTLALTPGSHLYAVPYVDDRFGGIDSQSVEFIVYGTLAIDETAGARPTILADSSAAGAWYGIRIMPGGRFETGIGATIENAVIGVSVALGAPADTLSKLAIRHCSEIGIDNGGGAVALCQDTVIGIPGSIGILADSAAPFIKSCVIESCGTGIKARFSTSTIRDTKIFGPGQRGLQIDDDFLQMQGVERQGLVHAASGEGSPASDIYMIADTISGYFSSAQLVMEWASGKCTIDSCGFVHPTGSTRSPYGLLTNTADTLTMHHSEITGYSSYGLYSSLSHIDAGKGSTNGNNSIFTDTTGCGGCLARRVYHSTIRTDTLKAEGNWWGTDNPSASWFSAKVDWNPYLTSPPSGKLATPDEGAEQPALPTGFTLSQNYPNPFNAGTQIEFSLVTAQKVEVKVYNILGQVVRVLANDRMEAGRHTVAWDGRNRDGEVLASGIYLYRLVAGDFVETKKMVLLK